MKVVLTHQPSGLTNVFEDLYIWELVRTNLQYDSELEEYQIEFIEETE
jgi:hypothetical protein